MFKLYKNLTKKDVFFVILIIGLTFMQVWLTMNITDYVSGIIKAITYVNYHNNVDSLGTMGTIINSIGWDNLKDALSVKTYLPGINDEETINMIVSVANASTWDIWYNGLMMLALAAGIMVVQGLISVIASAVASNLSTTIRTKLYRKVENLSLEEINKFSTPSLVTRTTNDVQQIQMANLLTMRMIFAAPITAVWAIIKIQASSASLTVVTAVAIIMLLILIGSLMFIALPKFKSMQTYIDKLNGSTRENLTGVRVIRAFNAEKYQEDKFDKANNNFTKAQIFTGRVMAILSPGMSIISSLLTLAIYWIGASLINKGEIDYATVTSFVMLASQIVMAFIMLMMLFLLVPRAIVSAKRINEVLDEEISIKDKDEEASFIEQGSVEFKNVSFRYSDGKESAVSDISFKINKGETLALIGGTGSGKSTIINLIPRLFEASEGEVLVNGVNVKDISQEKLRNVIGFVPQKGMLFKGSIKENIALSDPNMSEDNIKNACDIACATPFIEEKEKGFNEEISQGGKNVSGGQKQRLCIARAVAKHPQIYIFDDSFSALDYKTDKQVRENLKNSEKDATKIIVAQRIGTIIDADQILVIEDGKIVGRGKHQELLKTCKEYQEIALSQLSKEELGL